MITLSKSGSTVTFTFDENSGYLQNGTIDVPLNSLSLILDESNMATFKKSASNDIFVSANIAEFGMSKSELEAWYKENLVGSTGGGGTTYTAGRGISIDSANTISLGVALSASTGNNSIAEGYNTVASGQYSHAEGYSTTASGHRAHAEGDQTKAIGQYSHAEGNYSSGSGQYSHAEGYKTVAAGQASHAEGCETQAKNAVEHASGRFNVSRSGTSEGDFTLFTVGNGTSSSARHNAFEIRMNGDIYITKNGSDIKLQDNLGDSAITSGEVQTMINNSISSAITSGDTKAVAGGAVYDQLTIGGGMEEISSVTVSSSYSSVVMPDCQKFTISASTSVGDALTCGGKTINVYDKSTETLVFSSSTVSNMDSNYVTIEGTTADTSMTLTAVDGYYFKGDNSMLFKSNYSGGWVVTFYKNSDVEWLKDVVSANTAAISGKADSSSLATVATSGSYNDLTNKPTIPTTTSAVTSGSTAVVESGGVYTQMGGLKLQQISQSDYDALVQGGTVDNSTIYYIVN